MNTLKDQGNKAFAAKDYDKAIDFFTKAVLLDPQNHVLYSNRSAAQAGKKEWDLALKDAEEVRLINILSDFMSDLFKFAVYQSKPELGKRVRKKGSCSSWSTQIRRSDRSL